MSTSSLPTRYAWGHGHLHPMVTSASYAGSWSCTPARSTASACACQPAGHPVGDLLLLGGVGQDEHRRPGPRHHGRQPVRAQRPHQRHAVRHRRLAVLLVQVVPVSRGAGARAAGRAPRRAARRGRCWPLRPRATPRRAAVPATPPCSRRLRRHERHRRHPVVDGDRGRPEASPACTRRSRSPPSRRGPRCPGGPRSGAASVEHRVVVHSSDPPATSAARQRRCPPTIAAEEEPRPRAVRDPVGAVAGAAPGGSRPSARRPRASPGRPGGLVAAGRVPAPPQPLSSTRPARRRTTSARSACREVEGEPEGVEAGTEVGAGRRHLDGHRPGPANSACSAQPGGARPRRPRRRRSRCPRGR